ncbi:crotonase/enoyl-CoA hydratase family protein [Acinetobacter larvae]|uniref:Enoyl-CoA hydratase n=1 Tax=Acinetobacter larvae TaxID=1789224 RepID=A0A1B2M159_9GAMM|nr:crotonase/enoyl-CoA hydratase family protein [Acinetobacter larvae]AOA58934.1 enoyl-CoA hydratase [Acinetobacter larvae]
MTQIGQVTTETRDHIFCIGLDRAAKRNAFDSHMILSLSQALTHYERDPELRCAVIFAHGEHFSAGLDLLELQDKISTGIFQFSAEQINPWGTSGLQRSKPVVVAVQGTCYTAGIELMLNADVAIASDDCNFSQMEVLRGIMPFGGATVRFVQAAGWQKAMPYLLTGKNFDAQTAWSLNLVSEVVAKGQQLQRALQIAAEISHAAPLAVRALLHSAQQALAQGPDAAYAALDQSILPLFQSQDAQEGVMAMLEKRAPLFQGR